MRPVFKVAIVFVIAILLGSLAYVIFFTGEENSKEIKDTEAPTIDSIIGDIPGTTGKITTISVTFSDNIEVIVATMYYKTESADSWSNTSILIGNADIVIPSDTDEDWYYYVVVNDDAGNGPVGDSSTDGSSYYTIDVSKNVEDLVHYVFIEEGTVTWCNNCPAVARILHELYESGEYNFYYVSMVHDKNKKAKDQLDNEYNILGFPTVYIDGGYELVYGEEDKSVFEEKIAKAANRDVPEIAVNVTSEIDESGKRVETTVVIDNYESDTYAGRLKVYLTNRIAWADYDGDTYHFGFLDYIADEDVSINGEDQKIVTKSYDVSNLDVDNLMIIAVVFNDESTTKYSEPPDGNPFDAYYADASDGTLVVEGGNLPPEVGITNPKNGRLHIFGKEITATLKLKTILIGRTTITATASDDSKVEKVEFYIDDTLVAKFTEEPYEWTLKKVKLFRRFIIPQKHTISVIAYDSNSKTSTASIEVTTFLL